MEYIVRIHKKDKISEKKVEEGTNLLSFLRKNSVDVSSPCGGNGTCGKCRVRVSGLEQEPSGKEKKLLGNKDLEKGFRLACYNQISADIDIYMDKEKEEAEIMTKSKERHIKLEPVITKSFETMPVPSIHDQKSDLERVLNTAHKAKAALSIDQIRGLADIVRTENYKVTLTCMEKKLIHIEPGDTTQKLFGIAVDIGTTTIAAYLIDLNTGKKVDVYSTLNPQRKFGADVISRINYTIESKNALKDMHKEIITCMNQIVKHFTNQNQIAKTDIYAFTFAGNTTMMHFLMKIPAQHIAASPFIPVTTLLHKIKADELGLGINPAGYAIVFPCVSAYIGADTIAAVLSSGMYDSDKISLLVDLGTNGEIVLGNSKWMYSCSAAAGPAFEGANIRNGVGGIKGAIDKVKIDTELELSTIGNEKALGICGSGVVDAIAAMLSRGIIDDTGRILMDDEIESSLSEDLTQRLVNLEGMNSFLLLRNEECAAETDIAITQKDVRELQNAKAAIAAGIKILIKQAGIKVGDIDRVYLAGGFGSYINIESALKIGLLPVELTGKIESIGNAAGAGAVEGLLSTKLLKKTEELKDHIQYVELSACPDFMDEYVECMMFEN